MRVGEKVLSGRLTNSIDRNGVSTTNQFDLLDRLIERRLGGLDGVFSGREVFQYGARGLTNYCDALTNATRFVRDELGRVQYQTNANNEVLGFTYNPADQLLTLTDGKLQTNRWQYDGEGRVTNKVDALNVEMFRYQYDPAGQLTNRWQAGNVSTTFRFDALGNLTNVIYPAGTPSITLGYDPLNRLTNLMDGIGTTMFGWTDGNQLASEDGPWASDRVSFGYGARLRTSLSVQQPNASAWAQSYGFDPYWRLTNVVSSAGVFGTQYKSVTLGGDELLSDLVQRVDLPGGSAITNEHDGLGRLLATVLQNSQLSTLNSHRYEYNGGHQRTKQTFTAGNFADYTYDNIGQLQTARGKEAGGATRWHEQLGYSYDKAGNLSGRTNNQLVQVFSADSLNQLSTVSRSGTLHVGGTTTSPATDVTVNDQTAARYADNTFSKGGFSLADGDNTFTAIAQDSYGRVDTNTITAYLPATPAFYYDARGNLTNDGRRVFYYDAENQLVSVTASNAWRSEFQYDGMMRRRVRKEFAWSSAIGNWQLTNEVRYVYDGRLVVQERDANNLAQVTYTRGNDLSGTMQGAGGIGGLLARTRNSELGTFNSASAYFHADGNGNITALVSTNQIIVARYHYDPFGNTISIAGALAEANLYRFSSKEWHPNSGLVYYLYRYYDPNLQRWLNQDPLGDIASLPKEAMDSPSQDEQEGEDSVELIGDEFLQTYVQVNGNLHAFALNGPIIRIDKFGLQCELPPGSPGSARPENLAALDMRSAAEIAKQKIRQSATNKVKQHRLFGKEGSKAVERSRAIDPKQLKQHLNKDELKELKEVAQKAVRDAKERLKNAATEKARQKERDFIETQLNRARACKNALAS